MRAVTKEGSVAITADQREDLFVNLYLGECQFNIKDAFIKSGGSAKSAYVEAYKFLDRPSVSAKLVAAKQALMEHHGVQLMEVIREMKLIGFTRMDHFIEIDDDGKGVVNLKLATRDQLAAVESVKTIEKVLVSNDDGEKVLSRVTTIKLHDKPGMLDKLARMFGAYEGKEAPQFHLHNHQTTIDARSVTIINDPAEAAKDYKEFLGRS